MGGGSPPPGRVPPPLACSSFFISPRVFGWFLAGAHVAPLGGMDLATRVPWVAGNLSARTLATTRLSETWIHTQDIADAIGVDLVPSDRLKLTSRPAWRAPQ